MSCYVVYVYWRWSSDFRDVKAKPLVVGERTMKQTEREAYFEERFISLSAGKKLLQVSRFGFWLLTWLMVKDFLVHSHEFVDIWTLDWVVGTVVGNTKSTRVGNPGRLTFACPLWPKGSCWFFHAIIFSHLLWLRLSLESCYDFSHSSASTTQFTRLWASAYVTIFANGFIFTLKTFMSFFFIQNISFPFRLFSLRNQNHQMKFI